MNDHKDQNLRRELGVTRREMLRRGAIAGGTLLWAAPVIQTLGPAALAQAGSMSIHRCCFCSSPRRRSLPPTQCINNGMTPDEDACATLCRGLAYRHSSFCESKAPTNCDTVNGCACL